MHKLNNHLSLTIRLFKVTFAEYTATQKKNKAPHWNMVPLETPQQIALVLNSIFQIDPRARPAACQLLYYEWLENCNEVKTHTESIHRIIADLQCPVRQTQQYQEDQLLPIHQYPAEPTDVPSPKRSSSTYFDSPKQRKMKLKNETKPARSSNLERTNSGRIIPNPITTHSQTQKLTTKSRTSERTTICEESNEISIVHGTMDDDTDNTIPIITTPESLEISHFSFSTSQTEYDTLHQMGFGTEPRLFEGF